MIVQKQAGGLADFTPVLQDGGRVLVARPPLVPAGARGVAMFFADPALPDVTALVLPGDQLVDCLVADVISTVPRSDDEAIAVLRAAGFTVEELK